MSEIASQKVSITTTGAAGSATGSTTTIPIIGFLLDVYIDYHASAPATTHVKISDPTFGTIVEKADNATDLKLAPREPLCDAAAADTGLYDLVPINSALTVEVSGCDALTAAVVVTLRWMTP